MKQSHLFGKTLREAPKDIGNKSTEYLLRAGFIAESVAGRYYMLPLGMRVQDKIMKVIEEEMNATGAQKMTTPTLHPLELWKETNRTSSAGFELMKVADRRGAEFALGGTAEEMFVDLVRRYTISYKDLPFTLYQFSQKFRDELRARGGLLRVREFMMKDAYSFHGDEADFKREYEVMWKAYERIFERFGLKVLVAESDNGYIGGEYCHEFIVESEVGESKILAAEDGTYSAHEDVAVFLCQEMDDREEEKPMEDVEGKRIIGVEELAQYLNIPVEKTTKTILFEDEHGDVIAAAVRGGYDINETKLKHVACVHSLQLASAETVRRVTGAEVGYAGLLNLPKEVNIFMDESLRGRKNFEMGANRTDYHSVNVNFGRDIPEPEQFYDFKLAKAGFLTKDGKPLVEKKGIEVGNIFQLGRHYSSRMNAVFVDAEGKQVEYYMGCYGIGIGRTLATIVEKYHDEKGMIWPEVVAPFQAHLISLCRKEEDKHQAEQIYQTLLKNHIEVLFDDRDGITAGEKFADSDLIGIPFRLVVSPKTLEANRVELKRRTGGDAELLSLAEIIPLLEDRNTLV